MSLQCRGALLAIQRAAYGLIPCLPDEPAAAATATGLVIPLSSESVRCDVWEVTL
jgi:hypothetical protein